MAKQRPPSYTPEARENQLLSKAMQLVEKQLDEGSISATVLAELVKRASTKSRLEQEIMQEQKLLLKAKTSAIESSKTEEALYERALQAFSRYTNQNDDEEDEDYD